MTVTDAGPLVAVLDSGEARHEECVRALHDLPLPLITTWPAFTEAMYLVSRRSGHRAVSALWSLVTTDRLQLADLDVHETRRCAELMDQYADQPMDLADATLVVVAERLRARSVFTLDSDFQVYRRDGRHSFLMVP